MTISSLIGNTPMIELNLLKNKNVRLFVKLEGQNPGGSVKDRAALYMIEEAERRGELQPGKTILEATSGNMGIALAMIGAAKGYPVHIVMSAGMSEERKTMLRVLGAKLTLTDARLGTEGALQQARRLVKREPDVYWLADQFNNPDNALAHYHNLAPEILRQAPKIDYLIAGIGTSGTIMGLARRFREESRNTRLVGVVPPGGYTIQGLQNPREDFHGRIFEASLVRRIIRIEQSEAFQMARKAAKREGLFLGMSSGAVLSAAKRISRSIQSGTVVAIMPDRGEKYLSTPLFAQ